MTKIIAINAGSSSFKFELFEMPEETELARGLIERIGLDNGVFTVTYGDEKEVIKRNFNDHKEAVDVMLDALVSRCIITSVEEIDGTGHRVVHGGEAFSKANSL